MPYKTDMETGEQIWEPVFMRTPYNYDTDQVSRETGLAIDPEEGLTQQQFAEDADINVIVSRFGLTGQLPDNVRTPTSGDFTGISDFRTAMNAVIEAEQAFMELPVELRKRFGHDPQNLMDFMEDENNREEAKKLGLLKQPVELTRDVVQAVDELTAHMKQSGGQPGNHKETK